MKVICCVIDEMIKLPRYAKVDLMIKVKVQLMKALQSLPAM